MQIKEVVLAVVLVIIGLAFMYILSYYGYQLNAFVIKSQLDNPFSQEITPDNFNQYLLSRKIIRELPTNSIIELKLYNFESGERQWEKTYLIAYQKVVEQETVENADFTVILNSRYLPQFSEGFCETIHNAKTHDDVNVWAHKGRVAIAWKYRGVLKYQDCLAV